MWMIDRFRGSQKAKIDERGRIKIPSKFLSVFQDVYKNNKVYITSLNGDRVYLYPFKEWEQIENPISQKKVRGQFLDDFIRLTSFWGDDCDIDQRGRVLIQNELRQEACLDGQVLFVGKFDHIEIWNRDTLVTKYKNEKVNDRDIMDRVSAKIDDISEAGKEG
jgi:MraZ protein